MNTRTRSILTLVLVLLGGAVLWTTLTWVVAGGATNATSGDAALQATIGQPLVGVVSGGEITLGQGFWHGGEVTPPESGPAVYLPFVRKSS